MTIVIYGAGGFAREVAWLLQGAKGGTSGEVVGFVDDGDNRPAALNGRAVYSWDELTAKYPSALVAIAVGQPSTRRVIASRCAGAGYEFATAVHSSVAMSESVSLASGVIICAGSILTVDIVIGEQVHINLDCTVGHDVHIGPYATLAPGVHVSGNVHIGPGAYIGTGANIINGTSTEPLRIGEDCVIAAGACVTGHTDPNTLYAGVPAKPKKQLL